MTTAEAPVVTSEPAAFEKLDDAGLVSAIHDGDDVAFEVFYERYHAGVLSFCRHMLGNREDAEDAVQQTFLATYRHVRASSPPRHPRAWLFKVARNRCVTTLRARRETSIDTLDVATDGLADEVERRHELRELLSDLGRLPEDQRVALLLFELGALDQSEIAETIGCAPRKVKALVYQARTTLAHRAEARNARCVEVRQQLATLRGGALNSRALKHHLEICEGCREYREEVRRQRAAFGVILPVIPLAAAHGSVLGAVGLGSGASHAAPGWLAWLGRYAARPRIAVSTALIGGAVTVGLVTGGHEQGADEPVVPPAPAAVASPPQQAKAPAAPGTHQLARQATRREAPVRRPAARGTERRATLLLPPQAPRQPSAGEPEPAPKPETPKHIVHNAPPKAPPTAGPAPAEQPPAPAGQAPAPQPPSATPCHSNGLGDGNAWGHCRGPDGVPPPAEEHRQGQGGPTQ